MTLNAKDRIHGFVVTNVRESSELGGSLIEMTYEKTGTQLCWVNNGEKNKVFSVTFKTLPEDSTGVFHILEHSTLCGSAKYPVREPFVELLKSSMNTFLNAMTAQDWTMYPVSSRNDQDYLNLAEVYLDAVFAPSLLTNPNVFYQEGWHIEQEDGRLSYKGVVFNEMKGAMGDVDELETRTLSSLMFPDNCYGFNSGGDPEVIPSLTYEKYVETYHRFYHPGNARIYLDGAVPLEQTLALLDSYLSRFEAADVSPVIVPQIPKAAAAEITYELGQNEEITNKGRVAFGKIIGDWTELTRTVAADILANTLAGTNEAPLKRAILSTGLAQDMTVTVDDSGFQHTLMVGFRDVKDGCEEELLKKFREAVSEIVDAGIESDLLEATINRMEFRAREPEEHRGIRRCIAAMSTWLYDGDPMDSLTYNRLFAEVRAMLKNNQFEARLADLLLDESERCILYTRPSYTAGEEKRQAEAARLEAIRASWTDEDLENNRVMNERLQTWQATPDSEEALATLPALPLSAVSAEPSDNVPTEVLSMHGATVLVHRVPSNGLIHLNFYFALTDMTLAELGEISMLPSFLGHLPTAKHSALALQQMMKMYTGSLSFAFTKSQRGDDTKVCAPFLSVSCSVLPEYLDRAYELILEILTETDFTALKPIAEIVRQEEMNSVQAGVVSGHALGMLAAASHYRAVSAVDEVLSGHTQLKYLHELASALDEKLPAFAAANAAGLRRAVEAARLTVSVTSDQEVDLEPLLGKLPAGTAVPETAAYSIDLPEKLALRIPAQIGYAIQVWDIAEMGRSFHASQTVLSNILTLSYLWNVVRVQGGAYGTGIRIDKTGLVVTYSYRDPTPAASLKANGGLAGYIRAFCESGENLDKYIISTASSAEPLLSVRSAGMLADSDWMNGRTYEKRTALRRELLATTREDLLAACELLDAFAEKGAACIVGHEGALAELEGFEIRDL